MDILKEWLVLGLADDVAGLPILVGYFQTVVLCLNRSKVYLSLVSGIVIIINNVVKLRTTRAKK